MALPSPTGSGGGGGGSIQFNPETIREMMSIGFKSAGLIGMQNLLGPQGVGRIPGANFLTAGIRDRMDLKRREMFEATGRDAQGRKLTQRELEDREMQRKANGALGYIREVMEQQWGFGGGGDGGAIPVKFASDGLDRMFLSDMAIDIALLKETLQEIKTPLLEFIGFAATPSVPMEDKDRDWLSRRIQEPVRPEAEGEVIPDDTEVADALEALGIKSYADGGVIEGSPQGTLIRAGENNQSEAIVPLKDSVSESRESKTEDRRYEERKDRERYRERRKNMLKDLTDVLDKYFEKKAKSKGGGEGILGKLGNMLMDFGLGKLSKVPGFRTIGKVMGWGGEAAAGGAGKAVASEAAETGGKSLMGKALAKGKDFFNVGKSPLAGAAKSALSTGGKAAGGVLGKIGGFFSSAGKSVMSLASKLNPFKAISGMVAKNAPKLLRGLVSVPAIGALVEGFLGGMDIRDVVNDPNMSKEEKKTKIGQLIGKTLGSMIGSVGGGVLGTAIGTALGPGPGNLIGGILGSMGGAWVGGKIGEAISDVLGPKEIYDLVESIPGLGNFVRVEDGDEGDGVPATEQGSAVPSAEAQTDQSMPVATQVAPAPSNAAISAAPAMAQNSVLKTTPPPQPKAQSPVINNVNNSPTTTLLAPPSAREGGANERTVFNGMLAFG